MRIIDKKKYVLKDLELKRYVYINNFYIIFISIVGSLISMSLAILFYFFALNNLKGLNVYNIPGTIATMITTFIMMSICLIFLLVSILYPISNFTYQWIKRKKYNR